jgi:hypothetical protein
MGREGSELEGQQADRKTGTAMQFKYVMAAHVLRINRMQIRKTTS